MDWASSAVKYAVFSASRMSARVAMRFISRACQFILELCVKSHVRPKSVISWLMVRPSASR